MKKRLLSIILTFALILGILPISAQAASSIGRITTAETPKANYTKLNWLTSYDDGIVENNAEESPTLPIIVGDCLVYISDSTLYKADLKTGEIVKSFDMGKDEAGNENRSSYTYTAALHADGKIFVALTGGKVKAFDAENLTLLWTYVDELGGQDQVTPIYDGGYVYTGFFNGETKDANMVCLNSADGTKVWSKTHLGGYYWSDPVIVGDAILFGGDDGATGTKGEGSVYSLNKKDGTELSTLKATGDIRSGMVYDGGRVYFTSKSGNLYSASVDAAGVLGDLKSVTIGKASTCTPLIYGDYIYVTSSSKNFNIVKKDTMELVHTLAALPGYAQHSILLSTAYVESEGYLYFYTTYNIKPGGIALVKVDADATDFTAEGACTVEVIYDAQGHEEYCVSGIIADADGNIYYKNDSKTMFSLGLSKIEIPQITTNLSTDMVKYNHGVDTEAAALEITATVSDGGTLTYQWQKSADAAAWTDIAGATESKYVPAITELGTTYYRCIVSNNKDGVKESKESLAAEILVKVFSNDTTISYAVNNSNSATNLEKTPITAEYQVIDPAGNDKPRVWVAAPEEGTVTCEQVEGTDKLTVAKTTANGFAARLYFGSGVTMMNRIKVTATAEDGTQKVYYVIVTPNGEYTASTAGVNVTIVNEGTVVMAQQKVTAEDRNGDGHLNVDEVLVAAHNASYTGGAAAGYDNMETAYGLAITKLWGNVSGAYGYWLDNVSCMSLDDVVEEGAYLVAFAYKDAAYWSDSYAAFGAHEYEAPEGTVTVTVEKAGYDANWNTVFANLTGATIQVYDKDFKLVTEGYKVTETGNGTYEIAFAEAGEYYLAAVNDAEGIVPPVCKVSCAKGTVIEEPEEEKPEEEKPPVEEKPEEEKPPVDEKPEDNKAEDKTEGTPDTGDHSPIMMFAMLAMVSAMAVVFLLRKKEEN